MIRRSPQAIRSRSYDPSRSHSLRPPAARAKRRAPPRSTSSAGDRCPPHRCAARPRSCRRRQRATCPRRQLRSKPSRDSTSHSSSFGRCRSTMPRSARAHSRPSSTGWRTSVGPTVPALPCCCRRRSGSPSSGTCTWVRMRTAIVSSSRPASPTQPSNNPHCRSPYADVRVGLSAYLARVASELELTLPPPPPSSAFIKPEEVRARRRAAPTTVGRRRRRPSAVHALLHGRPRAPQLEDRCEPASAAVRAAFERVFLANGRVSNEAHVLAFHPAYLAVFLKTGALLTAEAGACAGAAADAATTTALGGLRGQGGHGPWWVGGRWFPCVGL